MKRIHEFEALRGLLALWVVVGHVLTYGGYTDQSLGPFHLLARPDLAVDVFITLSGFVIFDLLDTKRESYPVFITRRFFRIFPIYTLALAIGYLTAGTTLDWLNTVPWKSNLVEASTAFAAASIDNLNLHLLVHLTGLHGIVPSSLLPFSQGALVPQAWSISVEWQFYLLAPLLYYLLKKRPIILTLTIVGLLAIHSRYWLSEGFVVNQAPHFLTGIICYFLYKHCPKIAPRYLTLGAVLAIAAAGWYTTRPVSICVWVIFFAAALHTKCSGKNPISAFSSLAMAQFLGKISYSVYLLHAFIIMAVSSALLHMYDHPQHTSFVLAVMLITLPCTVLAAAATFTFIEKPGMEIGRYVGARVKSHQLVSETVNG